MIELYTWSTPNGQKASIMLEEVGLPYKVTAVNIGKGEQHHSEYRQISPNGKIPAILDFADGTDSAPHRIFESGNILVYLAEKTGQLLPASGPERAEVLGWLFFQMAHLGPIVGQWHWFKNATPVQSDISVARYREESLRLLEVMNGRLGEYPYLGGTEYSIADVASYAWARTATDELMAEGSKTAAAVEGLKGLMDWLTRVGERPAVRKGMQVPTEEQKEATEERASIKGPAGGGSAMP